ncbi:hypothetical protein [Rhodopirellula europaea]|uniref:Signal peptide protein n=1 Tax=Rhodopirellula europaea 6C TaxID=1263867 RepID=M2A9N2_9BACT|nr:hypothetical protein [Rhodopirellula europaea]EMB18936.1 signal peptide protein [Rhodopirellula europaea 6C]
MLTLFRFAALLCLVGLASVSHSQGVDDLFADSDVEPICECRHHIFGLDHPPEWIPKDVTKALASAVRSNEGMRQGGVLFCSKTNAVIECFALKRAYRFLVCPSDWQGFKPKAVTDEALIENGIPVDKIRAIFQSMVMGPIEVSFRARNSRGMMGSIEIEDK